jgi:glycosyltransferase involved in cell wall biosynthesis
MLLPKILIFGQPFTRKSGGGITLSNLFEGWDKDRIAVVSTGHMLTDVETDICNNYYQLGSKEHRWIFPFNKFQHTFPSGTVAIKITESKIILPQSNSLRKKFVDNFFFPLLKYFGIYYKLSSINLSPEFKNWITQYNPEVIYVQVSDRDAILFVQKLHAFFQKPMIIHVMDDWPSTISSSGLLKNYWRKKIDREFRDLLNMSSLLFTISDNMAFEYEKRYGKKCITFHNPINLEFWKKYQKNNYDLNLSPSILYAGRIGIGIEESLRTIAESIIRINKELQVSMKFILQTQERPPWLDKYDCVIYQPFGKYSDLPKRFSEVDLLILPYDFSASSIKFIKYSMPTKAPEYMVCGTPILIFAPPTTAIVDYANKFNWAKVVTKNSISELANAIRSLIVNKNEREKIATNAKILAEKSHDSKIVLNSFRKTISSLNNE